ncbi:MAG: hypothetical protein M0R73_13395 [Dehalococcoidia bacterium]|nr:hypothetical protein [Dehalococcoidia bacterium]
MSGELVELGMVDAPRLDALPLALAQAELARLRAELDGERLRTAGLERALFTLADALDAEPGRKERGDFAAAVRSALGQSDAEG